MKRSRLKELLRPAVREAVDQYVKAKEESDIDLQKKHPYLDLKNTPNVAGTIRAGTAMESKDDGQWEIIRNPVQKGMTAKAVRTKLSKETAQRYLAQLEKKFGATNREGKKRFYLSKMLSEASSTGGGSPAGSATGPFQTPYAFSDVGLDADKKKKKIATQLGYKILDPKKHGEEFAGLTEEHKYNVKRLVEVYGQDSHKPTLVGSDARVLYMKMLDYLLMVDDPKFEKIKSFRRAIDRISNPNDKDELKKYFNDDFSPSGSQTAWEYYK